MVLYLELCHFAYAEHYIISDLSNEIHSTVLQVTQHPHGSTITILIYFPTLFIVKLLVKSFHSALSVLLRDVA